MNVRLEQNWVLMGYDITFYERDPLRVMRLTDLGFAWEAVSDNTQPVAPTFHLPGEALDALLAEAEKVIPASHATERHLTDTITVRDRLLALVERSDRA